MKLKRNVSFIPNTPTLVERLTFIEANKKSLLFFSLFFIYFYCIFIFCCANDFCLCLLQDPHAEEFEDKDWTFVIENVSAALVFMSSLLYGENTSLLRVNTF